MFSVTPKSIDQPFWETIGQDPTGCGCTEWESQTTN
jgi:hypothetical protein